MIFTEALSIYDTIYQLKTLNLKFQCLRLELTMQFRTLINNQLLN